MANCYECKHYDKNKNWCRVGNFGLEESGCEIETGQCNLFKEQKPLHEKISFQPLPGGIWKCSILVDKWYSEVGKTGAIAFDTLLEQLAAKFDESVIDKLKAFRDGFGSCHSVGYNWVSTSTPSPWARKVVGKKVSIDRLKAKFTEHLEKKRKNIEKEKKELEALEKSLTERGFTISYEVIERKETKVSLYLHNTFFKLCSYMVISYASCHPNDQFNFETGKLVALKRAYRAYKRWASKVKEEV